MSVDEELKVAYIKLDGVERLLRILKRRETENYKVIDILIAAGFLTQEKIDEARSILNDL